MKKIIPVTIITILLITVVIMEQLFVHSTLSSLKAKVDDIDYAIKNNSEIDNENIITNINNLDEYWTSKERILCLSINHNDLNSIGEQIKKIKAYISQNKKEEALLEIELLIFYIDNYSHVMEITPQNIL